MSSTTLTVLIENSTINPALISQHGLSLWLEVDGENILIDTGQDISFLHNAHDMGIQVESVSRLVLTHGHYDHTGGVPALLQTGAKPSVIIHPQAWEDRISCPKDAPPRNIGIHWPQSLLKENNITFQFADMPQLILPNVWSTGNIPNIMGVSASKTFQRKHNDHWYTDSFSDEQSIIVSTELGLLIITGCCHTGVINTILTAQLITGIPHVYAIIGGLHLHDWEDYCIKKLAYDLQAFNIQHLWVNHCTGQKAFEILHKEIGKNVEWAGTGSRIELPAVCKNAI